jgi:hypothetical protein
MATLVTEIFAIWARIEYQLSLLLVQVLGATEGPALAMHSVLTSQQLQVLALDAAARAALSLEDYQIFDAVMSITKGVQTPRNHLAHWVWGKCAQRPDLLALVDPRMYKESDVYFRRLAAKEYKVPADLAEAEARAAEARAQADREFFDLDRVLAYSKSDLERAKRDLQETDTILFVFGVFLNPQYLKTLLTNRITGKAMDKVSIADLRAQSLTKLNEFRLFQEAIARVRGKEKAD